MLRGQVAGARSPKPVAGAQGWSSRRAAWPGARVCAGALAGEQAHEDAPRSWVTVARASVPSSVKCGCQRPLFQASV